MTKYLILIIVVLAIAGSIFFNRWLVLREQNKQITQYAIQKSMEVEYYKLENGQLVATKDAAILDLKTVKKLSEDKDLQWIKQFEGIKKNLRNLETATQINTETIVSMKGNITDTVVVVDSTEHKAFSFDNSDKWMEVKGVVIPDLKTVDTFVKVQVPIEGVMFWKRKKVLGLRIGGKEWSSEFTSPNPYTKITNLNQILIKRR